MYHKPIRYTTFLVLCALFISILSTAAMADTVTGVDGVEVTCDSNGSFSESGGTVTITVTGSNTTRKTTKITVTNTLATTATISFDYSASNYDTEESGGWTLADSDTGRYSAVVQGGGSFTFSLRSKRFVWNNKTATVTLSNFEVVAAAANSDVTVNYDSAHGSVTIDGTVVSSDTATSLSSDTSHALVATPNSSNDLFLGWIDSSNKIVCSDATYSITPTEDTTVTAVFAGNSTTTTNTAWFKVGEYLYNNLNTAASSGKGTTVILMNNGTITGSYTIPSGVTLLIPYSDENIFRGTPTNWTLEDMSLTGGSFPDPPEVNIVSAKVWSSTPNVEYRRLTMAEGAHITVNGSLEVSGQTHPLASGQWGNYAVLQMGSNTSITIGSTGTLYAYGYIRGNGTVTVASSGVVYEHYDVADYPPGGAGGLDPMNSAGVFGMTNYSFNSVEVPTTYNAGAELRAYLVMTGYNIGTNAFTRTFFGSDSDAIFNLTNGTITKTYSGGRQSVVIAGDVEVNKLYIKIALVNYTVDSSTTSGLPISHNWDITATNNSTVTLNGSVLMYAGSTLTVDNGSKIVIPSDIKLSLLDSESDPSAVATNAVLDVNGEIQVDGGFYNSYTNTSIPIIKSSGGTGKVIVNNVGSETTFNVRASGNDTAPVDITPAKLLNGDNTQYVETASETGTYTYYTSTARWDKPSHFYDETDPVVTAPTCTASGYTTHTCAVCGDSYQDSPTDATGHSYGEYIFDSQTYNSTAACANGCGGTDDVYTPVRFAAIQLSAESEVILMLKLTVHEEWLNANPNAKIVLTKPANEVDSAGEVAEYIISEMTPDANGRYILTQGIASGEMTSEVSFQVFGNDGNAVTVSDYGDDSFGTTLGRTVADYAALAFEKGDNEIKALSAAMMLYGGYAQTYFGVDSENLASAFIPENLTLPDGYPALDISDVTTEDIANTRSASGDSIGLEFSTQDITLDSSISMTCHFTLGGTVDSSTYKFVLTYVEGFSIKQRELTPTVDTTNGRISVTIADIPAAYWDYNYRITVTSADENVTGSYTLTCSVMAYVKECISTYDTDANKTDEKLVALVNLVKAMYVYGTAASAYFGK